MKKRIVTSVLALTLCCAPVAVLSGCSTDNSNVEIKQDFKSNRMTVDGVRTLYSVGENVDLNSATLALFDDDEFKIEKVDEKMISGFSSETVGKKTMSVVHAGHKVDVKYEVVSAESIINEAKAILNEQAFVIKATNNSGELVNDYICNKTSIYDEMGGTLLKNHYGKWFEYSQKGGFPTQKYVDEESETVSELMALLPSVDDVSEIKVLDNETVQIKMKDGSLETFKNKKLVSMEIVDDEDGMVATVSYEVENESKLEVPSDVEFEVSKAAALQMLKSAKQLYLNEENVKVDVVGGYGDGDDEGDFVYLFEKNKVYGEFAQGYGKCWIVGDNSSSTITQWVFDADDNSYTKFNMQDPSEMLGKDTVSEGAWLFTQQEYNLENILAVGGDSVNTHIIYNFTNEDVKVKMSVWLEYGNVVKIEKINTGEVSQFIYDFSETIPDIPDAEWITELSGEESKEVLLNAINYSKLQNKVETIGTDNRPENSGLTVKSWCANGIMKYDVVTEPLCWFKEDASDGLLYRYYQDSTDNKYYKMIEEGDTMETMLTSMFGYADFSTVEIGRYYGKLLSNGEFVITVYYDGTMTYEITIKDELVQSLKIKMMEDDSYYEVTHTYRYNNDVAENIELPDVEWILKTE